MKPPLPAASSDHRVPAPHRLPALHQTQPERLVAVIPRGRGEAAAFVGTPVEFIVAAGADQSERESLNSGVLDEHGSGSFAMNDRLLTAVICRTKQEHRSSKKSVAADCIARKPAGNRH
jgi:hypothetical protein